MAAAGDGNYLITAGSADDEGNFAMYGWTGDFEDDPIQASGQPLGFDGWDGSYEGTAYVDSLQDGTTIRVIQDVGTLDLYNTGDEAQDLAREYAKFVSHNYALNFDSAFTEDAATASPTETETPSPTPTATESVSPASTETPADRTTPAETPTEPAPADPVDDETPVAGAADSTGTGLASTGATVLAWIVLGLILLAIGITVVRHQRQAQH